MPVTYQKYFFWLAAGGWGMALLVHLVALAGWDVSERIPWIWLLHAGVFAVWLPTILVLRERPATARLGILAVLAAPTPPVLRWGAILMLVYTVANFLFFMESHPGSPTAENGVYSLQNHGTLIRLLTEAEYHRYKASEIRGFSGHWLAFYGFAAAALYPQPKPVAPRQPEEPKP